LGVPLEARPFALVHVCATDSVCVHCSYSFPHFAIRTNAQRWASFYQQGLARIEDRWAGAGQTGERFSDPHHMYAADLDLFGGGGLFELP
jgi:hypothetical protein